VGCMSVGAVAVRLAVLADSRRPVVFGEFESWESTGAVICWIGNPVLSLSGGPVPQWSGCLVIQCPDVR